MWWQLVWHMKVAHIHCLCSASWDGEWSSAGLIWSPVGSLDSISSKYHTCNKFRGKSGNLLTEQTWSDYICLMCKRTVCTEYPHEKILCDLKCMSVYLWAKNTIAVFQHRRLLMYWICQRIPSDQVQFSSTALISSAHQGFSVFPPLSASLPYSFPSSCLSFSLPPISQPSPHNSTQSQLAI